MATASSLTSTTLHYVAPPTAEALEHATSTVEQIVYDTAEAYGLDYSRMWATVQCEDPSLDPLAQSEVVDKNGPNGRENSWGVTQIDLDYNPDVTKAQAQDPYFSIDRMAQAFSKGKHNLYHCYRNLYTEK